MSVKHHITIFSTTTLLMLGVYTAFVGFFFFTYGAYTEKKVVGNQIDTLVDSFSEDFIFFAGQTDSGEVLLKKIGETISATNPPDLSEVDAKVEKSNSELIKTAIIVLSITFLVFLMLSIAVWYFGLSKKEKRKDPYPSIVQRIILLMIIVMLVEFLFFTLVAGNYSPVDPNNIKKALVESLQKYAKN